MISGEELRSLLDDIANDLEHKQRGEHGLCIGSLDVKALYPSLAIEKCARICADRVMKSPIVFEDVDYHWASIYLALNMTREQVIREDLGMLVPRRRSNQGKDPTVLTIETDEKVDKKRGQRKCRKVE